jgi:hypothetical protein
MLSITISFSWSRHIILVRLGYGKCTGYPVVVVIEADTTVQATTLSRAKSDFESCMKLPACIIPARNNEMI